MIEVTTEVVSPTENYVVICRTVTTTKKVCFSYIKNRWRVPEIRSRASKKYFTVPYFCICVLIDAYYSSV